MLQVTPIGKVDSKVNKLWNERDKRLGLDHTEDKDDVIFPGETSTRTESKKFLATIDVRILHY
jgi:hypothetical protein